MIVRMSSMLHPLIYHLFLLLPLLPSILSSSCHNGEEGMELKICELTDANDYLQFKLSQVNKKLKQKEREMFIMQKCSSGLLKLLGLKCPFRV